MEAWSTKVHRRGPRGEEASAEGPASTAARYSCCGSNVLTRVETLLTVSWSVRHATWRSSLPERDAAAGGVVIVVVVLAVVMVVVLREERSAACCAQREKRASSEAAPALSANVRDTVSCREGPTGKGFFARPTADVCGLTSAQLAAADQLPDTC